MGHIRETNEGVVLKGVYYRPPDHCGKVDSVFFKQLSLEKRRFQEVFIAALQYLQVGH